MADREARPLHVVLGTGPVGLATANALAEQPVRVQMVCRTARRAPLPNVEIRSGDLADAAFARTIGTGASTIYNCACPPYHRWVEEFPAIQDGAVRAARVADAHLVNVENLYVYGDPAGRPMEETDAHNPCSTKGTLRSEMAGALSAEHAAGRLRVSHVRPSDLFGPGVVNSALGAEFFGRIAQHKPPRAIGNIDALHTWSFITDVGRTLARVGLQRTGADEVWHVPSAEPASVRQIAALTSEILGKRLTVSATHRWVLTALGVFQPPVRELVEMLYEYERPFIMSSKKTRDALDLTPTPFEAAVRQTVAWFQTGTIPMSESA